MGGSLGSCTFRHVDLLPSLVGVLTVGQARWRGRCPFLSARGLCVIHDIHTMATLQAKVRNTHRRATLGPQMPKTTVELEEAIRFRMSKEDKRAFEALPYWLSDYVHAGPFRLVSYQPGLGATFEAYDSYFLGRPRVDRITMREILNANSTQAAVLAGEIDLTFRLFEGEAASTLQDQWEAPGRGRVRS